jgi:hypothetical protein
MSGPSHLRDVIVKANEVMSQENKGKGQRYMILVILTDGEIMDMDEVIPELIEASLTPLSIIIVGMGDRDFSNLHQVNGVISRGNKHARREFVQFVPFSDYENSGEALVQATLSKIPEQFVSAMRINYWLPKKVGSDEHKE